MLSLPLPQPQNGLNSADSCLEASPFCFGLELFFVFCCLVLNLQQERNLIMTMYVWQGGKGIENVGYDWIAQFRYHGKSWCPAISTHWLWVSRLYVCQKRLLELITHKVTLNQMPLFPRLYSSYRIQLCKPSYFKMPVTLRGSLQVLQVHYIKCPCQLTLGWAHFTIKILKFPTGFSYIV